MYMLVFNPTYIKNRVIDRFIILRKIMDRMINRKEIQTARVELLTSMWNKFLSHSFDKVDQGLLDKLFLKDHTKEQLKSYKEDIDIF